MAIERRKAAGKRRASDHMFQAIFMAMDEGVVLWNKSGEVAAVNPAAENILGLAAKKLIGLSSAEVVQMLNFITENETPLSHELHAAMLALQSGKRRRNVLAGAHRPDGTLVWLSMNSQPLALDGESAPYAIVTTFRNVTERKRTEDALSFVEQRGWVDSPENFFNALVQYLGKSLGVNYVIISRHTEDPDNAETVALHAKGTVAPNLRYKLKGTPCENVMGKEFCFYPQGIQQLFPEVGLLVEMGAESYAGLPLWDSADQPIGLLAILDDKPLRDEAHIFQTLQLMAARAAAELERERNESMLRKSELEFRSLAENIPDNVARYDRHARLQYINPAMITNLAPEYLPVPGESLTQTYPVDDIPAEHQQAIERIIETGTPAEFELQLPNSHGEMRIHHVRYVAERGSDGEIVGVLGIGRDITERKRNETELKEHRHHLEKLVEERTLALSIAKESAEAATRAKSHFLAAASHDLRQPLQAISLFNDALSFTGLNEKQKKISRNLSKSVNSLGELLNQLLDLSRLDAGMIKPQRVAIKAENLLGMIGAEFEDVSQEKNLRLNLFCPRGRLALFSDENLLLTLLRNLVSNAVKYTTHGGVLVSIRRRGDCALIQVWDTGIGIAPVQTALIFKEYYQVDNPGRDRAKGVGLGLSIVRRLSQLLDIKVSVRSREGKGSVFELSVPLANESNKHSADIPTPETAAKARLANKRIVVVEDDATVADAIKLSLEIEGAHVNLFRSAEDALGNAKVMGADLYISDYRLPNMNGLQLFEAIQKNSAEPIKAVLLTGNTMTDKISDLHSSPWSVLFKPISLPTLLSALE